MFSRKRILFVIIAFVVIIAVSYVFLSDQYQPLSTNTSSQQPVRDASQEVSVENVVDQAPQPTTETSETHSPDGRMNLTLEKVTSGDSSTYSVYAAEIPGGQNNLIFQKTLPAGSQLAVSPNAWSPNNKYFFVEESGPAYLDYFVFQAKGESFAEGQYIDILPIYQAKGYESNLSKITGWDSPTLLHVFTAKPDGGNGPSFWFEIPSGALIQLSGR